MGACFSSQTIDISEESPTAKVVSLEAHLLEYNLPISVSQVIVGQVKDKADQSSPPPPPCFLCNSDRLLYDEFIPALDMEDQLQVDKIYFLLPASKLQYRLSASDMAALAVKASLALQNASKLEGRNKSGISPVLLPGVVKSFDFGKPPPPPRSASVRRLHRYTSRRAKLAVRSFRLRLSTIYEGIVL